MFVLVRKRLSLTSRLSGCASIINTISTPIAPRNNSSLLWDGPDQAELTSFLSAQPPPATTITPTSPPCMRSPQKEEVTAERRKEKGKWKKEIEGEKKGMQGPPPPNKPTPPNSPTHLRGPTGRAHSHMPTSMTKMMTMTMMTAVSLCHSRTFTHTHSHSCPCTCTYTTHSPHPLSPPQ